MNSPLSIEIIRIVHSHPLSSHLPIFSLLFAAPQHIKSAAPRPLLFSNELASMVQAPKKRSKASKPRSSGYNKLFGKTYGLTPIAIGKDPVAAVDCRFCHAFGREAKLGAKRAPIKKVKQFQSPYRQENFRLHLETEHATQWAKFQSLSAEDKDTFFTKTVSFGHTMRFCADPTQKSFQFWFDAPIIEKLVGDMLWGEDDLETREKALGIFEKVDADDPADVDVGTHAYRANIDSDLSFSLIVRYIGTGMSLRQATIALEATKDLLRNPLLGFPSQAKTQSYVRVACAVTFQVLSSLLPRLWAFSLAVDASTCQGSSYLDMRVRFVLKGVLYNLHVVALPLSGSHTGEAQFNYVCAVLDVLCPRWKQSLISATTDGARDMTGRHSGLVTRLMNVVSPGFLRVWCLLHQLDILMQRLYHTLDGGRYWSTMTAIVGHLRRQRTLIDEMGAMCPLLRDTRWESMHHVSSFMDDRQHRITDHYHLLSPEAPASQHRPSISWWVINAVVSSLTGEVNAVSRRMQGKGTLLSQQAEALEQLRGGLISDVGIVLDHAADDDEVMRVGRFSVSKAKVVEHIKGVTFRCSELFGELSNDEKSGIVACIGDLILRLVEGLGEIVAMRDDINLPSEQAIPPALPQEYAALSTAEMKAMILLVKERLLATPGWHTERLDSIVKQHKMLAAKDDPLVVRDLAGCDTNTPFKDAWALPSIEGKLDDLVEFAGGYASVFPNTATVEADFSDLKYEKDIWRKSLSNLSLQGILHCQQLATIEAIPRP